MNVYRAKENFFFRMKYFFFFGMKYVCLPNESACWLRPHGIQRVSVRAWEEKNCFRKMFLKNNNKLFCNEATKDQDTEAKK